jgi:hypothetical protein
VQRLNLADGASALRLFRSNREAGALMVLAFVMASWLG